LLPWILSSVNFNEKFRTFSHLIPFCAKFEIGALIFSE
jgi:hypothetical protein